MNDKLLNSIVISSSILILFLLILPAFDQTRMLMDSIEARERVLEEAQKMISRIEELNREIETRKGEVEKIDQLVPREKQLPELLSNLEAIVSASGMIMTEMNLSEVSGQEEVKKINGSLKLNGSFGSFMNFLDLLEKNLRLIDVDTIEVAIQSLEGSQALNYDVKFGASYLASE